jgi:signal transduction histidine kinase
MTAPDCDAEILREALLDLQLMREHEARARRDSDMLLHGLRSLNEAQNPEEIFAALFAQLREQLGCADVFVLRREADGLLVAGQSTHARFECVSWQPGALFERVMRGNVVASFDVGRVSEWTAQPAAVLTGVTSALHGPLTPAGRPGLMVATHPDRGYFTRAHAGVMQRMLLLVQQALVHVEARESLARERALLVRRDQLQEMVDAQTADLLEAKRAADEANESRARLVASLGHELRSPLHAVIAYSDLGLRNRTPDWEKVERYFERIRQSGETLLDLVDRLLEFARMEAGMMPFDFERSEVATLVRDVVAEFDSLAETADLHLATALADVVAVLDRERFRQVLRNLLSNAIKFSPRGGTVGIELRPDGSGFQLAVDDSGPGVPDADRERIFRNFVQATEVDVTPGGTGLGLSICREIVHAHRGRIWVEQAPSGGARFALALPGQPAADAVAAEVKTGRRA